VAGVRFPPWARNSREKEGARPSTGPASSTISIPWVWAGCGFRVWIFLEGVMKCEKCGLEKTGTRNRCLPCRSKQERVRRREDLPRQLVLEKARRDKYRGENPERFKKLSKSGHLRLRYGLDLDGVHQILARQGGVCRICGGLADCVDHRHKTGQVRGILCRRCNAGLGQFDDRRELLLKAVDYLDETEREEQESSGPRAWSHGAYLRHTK
jgi:hypothetical protein